MGYIYIDISALHVKGFVAAQAYLFLWHGCVAAQQPFKATFRGQRFLQNFINSTI